MWPAFWILIGLGVVFLVAVLGLGLCIRNKTQKLNRMSS